ncbi:MAG TPA: hypothetical protein VK741_09135 [Acetobacteraceae bacterium]|nr:hypothetical protein [Acetobacteraceae bacterium]
MTEQPAALPARSVRRALLQAFNTENTKNHGVARSLAARSRVPRHGIQSLNDTQAVGCNVPRRESRSVLSVALWKLPINLPMYANALADIPVQRTFIVRKVSDAVGDLGE